MREMLKEIKLLEVKPSQGIDEHFCRENKSFFFKLIESENVSIKLRCTITAQNCA